ncbi:MAG: glycoside hydrolase family 127 protein [Prolixibacteraceae bacterium]|nr:glycoside hydrolase family 127 protein [Prolixibacteraceae bacterium]
MKLSQLIAISGFVLFFMACGKQENALTIVNSKSFAEKQITLDDALAKRFSIDTTLTAQEPTELINRLDELISRSQKLKESESDSLWISVQKSWEDVKMDPAISSADTTTEAKLILQKWAELNIGLLKFSGEVRFGDALEKLVYEQPVSVLSEGTLKSVIYTHLFDQIFINLLGSSSLIHYHTTGGTVKLTQRTDFPKSNIMTLTCETNDARYLDVFIRIPEWAVNPTVAHGNVKYVARPGEYCQISRKWKDKDEFFIILKN